MRTKHAIGKLKNLLKDSMSWNELKIELDFKAILITNLFAHYYLSGWIQ